MLEFLGMANHSENFPKSLPFGKKFNHTTSKHDFSGWLRVKNQKVRLSKEQYNFFKKMYDHNWHRQLLWP